MTSSAPHDSLRSRRCHRFVSQVSQPGLRGGAQWARGLSLRKPLPSSRVAPRAGCPGGGQGKPQGCSGPCGDGQGAGWRHSAHPLPGRAAREGPPAPGPEKQLCDVCSPRPPLHRPPPPPCGFWPQFPLQAPTCQLQRLSPPPTSVPSPVARPSCLGPCPSTKLLLETWDPPAGSRDLARMGRH